MKFAPVINYGTKMSLGLKYGLEMLVAHCVATGMQEIDVEFVMKFLRGTPYASSAKNFRSEHLMPAFTDDQR